MNRRLGFLESELEERRLAEIREIDEKLQAFRRSMPPDIFAVFMAIPPDIAEQELSWEEIPGKYRPLMDYARAQGVDPLLMRLIELETVEESRARSVRCWAARDRYWADRNKQGSITEGGKLPGHAKS